VLGRRDAPDGDSLLELLEEIEREHAGAALDAQDVSVVVAVLRSISDQAEWLFEDKRRLPLLTKDLCLAPHTQVYDDDAGIHMDGIRPGAVPIVHPDVPKRLRSALRMLSLADALQPELAAVTRLATDPRAQRVCNELEHTLRSAEFAAGLMRFIKDRLSEAGRPDLRWLRDIEVQVVEPFETVLWLTENGARREVGRGRAQFHFAVEHGLMYVSVVAYDAAATLVAREIQQQLGLGPLGDLSPLSEILRADPRRIDALLTTLSVRAVREEADVVHAGQDEAVDVPMSFADVEGEWDESFEDLPEDQPEEWEEEPPPEASAEVGVPVDQTEDDLAWAEEADAVAVVLETPTERPTAGDLSSRSVMSDGPSPDERPAVDRERMPADDWGSSLGVRHGGDGPSLSNRPAPREAPHSGRIGSAGVPDPEARRLTPYQGSSQSWSLSSRGFGEAGHPARAAESGSSRRVVTYVIPAKDGFTLEADAIEADVGDDETPANIAIGRAAEGHVEAEETRTGRLVERMPHNNPGYDILSVGAGTGDIRFIEVKGMSGEWSAAGVPLSARQFALAWRERERYWLYVVEFAQDPDRRRVTRLQDPVGKIMQYRVDSGWRALASISGTESSIADAGPIQPAAGDLLTLSDDRSGTVLEVRGAGTLLQLVVQFSDEHVESLLYKPDRMTVSRPQRG
jgi:hypothetical protein